MQKNTNVHKFYKMTTIQPLNKLNDSNMLACP